MASNSYNGFDVTRSLYKHVNVLINAYPVAMDNFQDNCIYHCHQLNARG